MKALNEIIAVKELSIMDDIYITINADWEIREEIERNIRYVVKY